MASLWNLPVLYLCENNGKYGAGRAVGAAQSPTMAAYPLTDLPKAYKIPARADGRHRRRRRLSPSSPRRSRASAQGRDRNSSRRRRCAGREARATGRSVPVPTRSTWLGTWRGARTGARLVSLERPGPDLRALARANGERRHGKNLRELERGEIEARSTRPSSLRWRAPIREPEEATDRAFLPEIDHRARVREMAYYEAKLEALREIIAADERVHLHRRNPDWLPGLSPHRVAFAGIMPRTFPDRIDFAADFRAAALRTGHRGGHGRIAAGGRSHHRQLRLRGMAADRQRSGERVLHVGRADAGPGRFPSAAWHSRRRRGPALAQSAGDAVELSGTANRASLLAARHQGAAQDRRRQRQPDGLHRPCAAVRR